MGLEAKQRVEKHSGETLILDMDFSAWMLSTDTITNQVVTHSPVGLTITDQFVNGQSVRLTVSGGSSGVNYKVSVQIVTSAGETLIGEGILIVRG